MPASLLTPPVVATSWYDDAASGLKIAELLSARGLPSTFYVPTARQILGKEVTRFCYPQGRFNARVVREVAQAGYREPSLAN